MSVINIKDTEFDLEFKQTLTLGEFINFSDQLKEPLYPFYWWYHISENGLLFLEFMSTDREEFREKSEYITWRNWHKFVPLLRQNFFTFREYYTALHNVYGLKSQHYEHLVETSTLRLYLFMKSKCEQMSYSEIIDMKYKTFLTLYSYSIGDSVSVNWAQEEQHYG